MSFVSEERKRVYYKISSAYFNYILKLPHNFDGLAYPSANTDGSGLNVALRKSMIDEGVLVFFCAMLHRLRRNDSNKRNLSVYPCSQFSFPDIDGNLAFILDEEARVDFETKL